MMSLPVCWLLTLATLFFNPPKDTPKPAPPDLSTLATPVADAQNWLHYLWRDGHTLIVFSGDEKSGTLDNIESLDTRTGWFTPLSVLNQRWKRQFDASSFHDFKRYISWAKLSPDGNWMLWAPLPNISNGGLEPTAPLPHTVSVPIPEGTTVLDVALSPDGMQLAWNFSRELPDTPETEVTDYYIREIWVSRADGSPMKLLGSQKKYTKRDEPGDLIDYTRFLHWTPDGKRISFIHGKTLYTVKAPTP